ncbi:MAG: DUF6783 domain-containing protein [Ruminococcus sp.]|uniref:DUF6783 domain-containing protein n=1 Tax=Clostridia TaxID=186801 RepID=UPI0034A45762
MYNIVKTIIFYFSGHFSEHVRKRFSAKYTAKWSEQIAGMIFKQAPGLDLRINKT